MSRMHKTLIQLVYARQHKWLGYVLRMDDERIAKTVLQEKVEGTRRMRKSITTRMSANEERTEIKLNRAKKLAQDREKSTKFA